MNLPPPGSPDFEKLISGQPKPDCTKAPQVWVPSPGPQLVPFTAKLEPFSPVTLNAKPLALFGKPVARNAVTSQLDCTELEAKWVARAFDWDARDRQLAALKAETMKLAR